MGGSVILEGQRRPVTDLLELPSKDFHIRTLNLTSVTLGAYGLRDELKRLPPLPHLKELYLNGRLWYDQPVMMVGDTMAYFSSATGLEKLVFSKPVQTSIPLNDAFLKKLPIGPSLHEARLLQTTIAGESLAPLTQLQYLDVSFNAQFTDRGMASLAGMQSLSKLYLPGTAVTDAGLKNIADLKNLTELDLAGVAITDAGMASLAGLTKLRRLDLSGARITDAGLDALRGMKALEILNLYRSGVSDAGVAKLAELKRLRTLDLRYSQVTGIETLSANLPNCRIEFQGSSNRSSKRQAGTSVVTVKAEQAIADWARSLGGKVSVRNDHIAGMTLAGTRVVGPEFAAIVALPQLEELNLDNCQVRDEDLLALAGRQSGVRRLSLKYADLTDKGLSGLDGFPKLTHLDLAGVDVGNNGLTAIAALTQLEDVNLSYGRFDDSGMQALAALKHLRRLNLMQTKLGDRAMDAVAGLSRLESLDLSYTSVGDAGLAKLRALTALAELRLDHAEVTDASLKMLADFHSLRKIDLYHTLVTDQGVKALIAALPECRVYWDRDSGRRERRS
jgi:Leucine-rich repeat (LRR) protein